MQKFKISGSITTDPFVILSEQQRFYQGLYTGINKNVDATAKIETFLRAIDSKYRESNDSSENSDFLLLRQKDPFGELLSEIYFKSSSELTFF